MFIIKVKKMQAHRLSVFLAFLEEVSTTLISTSWRRVCVTFILIELAMRFLFLTWNLQCLYCFLYIYYFSYYSNAFWQHNFGCGVRLRNCVTSAESTLASLSVCERLRVDCERFVEINVSMNFSRTTESDELTKNNYNKLK